MEFGYFPTFALDMNLNVEQTFRRLPSGKRAKREKWQVCGAGTGGGRRGERKGREGLECVCIAWSRGGGAEEEWEEEEGGEEEEEKEGG